MLRNEGEVSGQLRFTDVGLATGSDDLQDSRGFAVADFDRDGDLDLAVNHNPGDADRPELGQARLYRNEIAQDTPWIALELEGTVDNRDGVGAVVRVYSGDLVQTRRLEAGSGYASQHGHRLYFGLGGSTEVHRISVRWPNGDIEEVDQPLAPGASYRLRQGQVSSPELMLPSAATPESADESVDGR